MDEAKILGVPVLMEQEHYLRQAEAKVGQEILDVQAEMAILNARHTELVSQRVELVNEIGKYVIARTEL